MRCSVLMYILEHRNYFDGKYMLSGACLRLHLVFPLRSAPMYYVGVQSRKYSGVWSLSDPSGGKVWLQVPWGSEPRITVLAKTRSNLAVSQSIFSPCLTDRRRPAVLLNQSRYLEMPVNFLVEKETQLPSSNKGRWRGHTERKEIA
jgi:hypothetical protein